MKRVLLLALTCISLSCWAQIDTIRWTLLSSLPDTPRTDAAYFVIDSSFYIVGGVSSSYIYYNAVWKYNIVTDQWQRMRDFPGGPITEANGFAINGNGYLCCGIDSVTGYNYDNEVWEYFPPLDTWQHKANFPGGSRGISGTFVYDNYGYISLGISNSGDTWRYDPVLDNWDSMASFPRGIRDRVAVVLLDSFAYFPAGYSFSLNKSYRDMWRYDIKQNHWDSIGLMPGSGRGFPLLWGCGKSFFGGFGELVDSVGAIYLGNDCYKYSIDSNRWHDIVSTNFIDSTAEGATFVYDKKGFFFGGYKTLPPNFSMYNKMWSFDASKYLRPDTTTGISTIDQSVYKVYPNPVSAGQHIYVNADESGEVVFSDMLGQVIQESHLQQGTNIISLHSQDGIILYHATTQSGRVEMGRIVVMR